jgi:hypothetical protein
VRGHELVDVDAAGCPFLGVGTSSRVNVQALHLAAVLGLLEHEPSLSLGGWGRAPGLLGRVHYRPFPDLPTPGSARYVVVPKESSPAAVERPAPGLKGVSRPARRAADQPRSRAASVDETR